MAEIDPNTPQVVDPERTVDLTRLLQIRGPLGVLNVLDTIVPVVNMGDVVVRTVRTEPPFFTSTDIFSVGVLIAAAINTIHADTGAVAEGVYDVQLKMGVTEPKVWDVQHRNAANNANLAVWSMLHSVQRAQSSQSFAYELGPNERLRILNASAVAPGVSSLAWIFAKRRA